jgi:hypothetical protein
VRGRPRAYISRNEFGIRHHAVSQGHAKSQACLSSRR